MKVAETARLGWTLTKVIESVSPSWMPAEAEVARVPAARTAAAIYREPVIGVSLSVGNLGSRSSGAEATPDERFSYVLKSGGNERGTNGNGRTGNGLRWDSERMPRVWEDTVDAEPRERLDAHTLAGIFCHWNPFGLTFPEPGVPRRKSDWFGPRLVFIGRLDSSSPRGLRTPSASRASRRPWRPGDRLCKIAPGSA